MGALTSCVSFPPPASEEDARGSDGDTGLGCEDRDRDGYLPMGCSQEFPADCSEGNSSVHPGAKETCDDEIDSDCDGVDLACANALVGNDVTEGGGYRITNGAISAFFDRTYGHMLSSLSRVGSLLNLLHAEGGNDNKFMGIALYDEAYQWQASEPTVEVLASGPAVFRFRVQSELGATLPKKGRRELETDSTYTVFPDGRIHRQDHVDVTPTLGSHLSGYLALDPELFSRVRSSYDPSPANGQAVPSDTNYAQLLEGTEGGSPAAWACAHTEGDQAEENLVGFVHYVPDAVPSVGPAVRYTRLAGAGSETLSLLFDWHRPPEASGPVTSGEYSGDFLVWAGAPGSQAEPCRGVDSLGDWLFRRRATLRTNSSEDEHSFDSGGGFWNVDAAGQSALSLRFDAESGQRAPERPAFRISELSSDLGETGLEVSPLIALDDEVLVHGRDYLWQVEGEIAWLYVHREVLSGEILQIRLPTTSSNAP